LHNIHPTDNDEKTILIMKNLLLTLITVVAMSACGDIFETDITGKNIAVVAPTDKAEIVEGVVTFRWSALNGAERYRVTVVSPDFEHSNVAIRDTVLYHDSLALSFGFGLELAPADYQWRIQAFSKSYESATDVYDLTVVPIPVPPEPVDPDISGNRVAVVAPIDRTEIEEGTVPFRWTALNGADKYRVTIVSPDFEHARLAVRDTILLGDSLSLVFGFRQKLTPAKYQWSIQAFNKTYESVRSVYNLTVETKEPIVSDPDISGKRVVVVAPIDKTNITEGKVKFLWDELDGTDRYRITVVSPNFEHASRAIHDEVIYRDSLSMGYGIDLELTPAKYQWSIQAFNKTYESVRSVYNLTVEPQVP
jgi:stress-induced morphogen